MNEHEIMDAEGLMPAVDQQIGSYAGREAIPALIAALSKAQGEFLPVGTNAEGKITPKEGRQGFTFRYAELSAFIAASQKALTANGLAVTAMPVIRDGAQALSMLVLHKDGGFIRAEAVMPRVPDGGYLSQMLMAWGGAVSFLRRYLYKAVLNMAEVEEEQVEGEGTDDLRATMPTTAAQRAQAPFPKHPEISKAASVSELSRVMTRLEKADKAKFAEHYNARAAELRHISGADDHVDGGRRSDPDLRPTGQHRVAPGPGWAHHRVNRLQGTQSSSCRHDQGSGVAPGH